jgi:hypothetical protein
VAISSGERIKSIHPLAIALPGMSGCPAVSGFCAIVMPPASLMPHSAAAPSPSKPETMTAISLPPQNSVSECKKNRDHVGLAPWLGKGFKAELAIENVQIPLRRDNIHVIGLNKEPFRDQLNRHLRIARENLMEKRGHGSEVIDDHHCNSHIGGQMP